MKKYDINNCISEHNILLVKNKRRQGQEGFKSSSI